MIKFIKKYYIQLIAVIIFFGIIVIMIFQSVKIIGFIKDKSIEYKNVQLEYALAEDFLHNIHKLKQSIKYIDENRNWTQILLPNDDDKKVQLFSDLEKLAKETGNNNINLSIASSDKLVTKKVKQVVTKKQVKPALDNYLSINISLIGNQDDLIYFLEKLENMQYFADVLWLDVNKTGARSISEENEEMRVDLLETKINIVFYLEDNK